MVPLLFCKSSRNGATTLPMANLSNPRCEHHHLPCLLHALVKSPTAGLIAQMLRHHMLQWGLDNEAMLPRDRLAS